ncbi:glycoside hydrolase family 26 protein [Geodermatophilus sp. URMC 61]|uniref:glycoside hydrolase family 26 protein n=1 Tax=Geodermatophilus sp. URMC 61 TaxID=3423411 RepID=UPI00406C0523
MVLAGLLAATSLSGSAPLPPPRIFVGVYSGYSFPGDLDGYIDAVGAAPDIVMWFQNWEEPLYYGEQMRGVAARGATPLITWSPGEDEDFDMRDLLAGEYDDYITRQADRAADWGRPMMIRPFHEMNGTWTSYGPPGTTPADFVSGWRHVVDLFRDRGVRNVSWVWTPNVMSEEKTTAVAPLYPGDDYTDWVGVDGYNFGAPWLGWRTLFEPTYRAITSFTSKPFMIAEWGSAERGGDKAAWITEFFRDMPEVMPAVQAVVSFDRVAEEDFRIDSSAAALAAYRAAVCESEVYGGGAAC